MRPTPFLKLALIGIALIGATAAHAAIKAKAPHTQADRTTTLNVKLALLDKLGNEALLVDVDSHAKTVRLAGTVGTKAAKDRAGAIALDVRGVNSVENAIRVEVAVADPAQADASVSEAGAAVDDAVLETKLRLALVGEMGTDGYAIGTDAAAGVVTLSFDPELGGDSRERAVAIVTRMAGVSKVVSADKTR